MDQEFTEHEIKAVVLALQSDKASRTDGFSGLFYKKCWEVIRYDVISSFNRIGNMRGCKMELINRAHIALIPKKLESIEPKDYRPISLVHGVIKILTKVMANKLAPKMVRLISSCQSAFIKGRALHDNFIYVQGGVKHLRPKKKPTILLKLDINKAFDSISWEFVLDLLTVRSFGPKWAFWLSRIVSTSSTHIIVNGSLTDSFSNK